MWPFWLSTSAFASSTVSLFQPSMKTVPFVVSTTLSILRRGEVQYPTCEEAVFSTVSVSKPWNMILCYYMIPPACGRQFRVEEFGIRPWVDDSIERTHCPLIQTNLIGNDIVRLLHSYTQPVCRDSLDPGRWSSIIEGEDSVIQSLIDRVVWE